MSFVGIRLGLPGAPLGGVNAAAGMPQAPVGYQWAFVYDSLNGNAAVYDSQRNNARVVALKPIGA